MIESFSNRTGRSPDISSLGQTLFDRDARAALPDTDAFDRYRTASIGEELRGNLQPYAADAEATITRQAQTAPSSMDQAVQSSMAETYTYVRSSWNSESAKKDSSSDFLVYALEGAAAVVLIRLGLKHLSKNGINIFGEAENVAKGVGAKLNARAKSLTQPSTVDLPPNSVGLINTHPLPRIRTNERETGPFNLR
jgi:hypothetical protein